MSDTDPQTGSGTPAGDGGSPEKTLTQSQVDAIVQDRVQRERAKYSDYDELKAKASKVDQLEEAQKTELQKAIDRAEAAERERDSLKEQITTTTKRQTIMDAAIAAKSVDPAAVADLLLSRNAEVPDAGAAKKVVEDLLKEKAYLGPAKDTPPPPPGGEFTGEEKKTLQQQIADAESSKDWPRAAALKMTLLQQQGS